MVVSHLKMQFVFAALLALGIVMASDEATNAADLADPPNPTLCGSDQEACIEPCKQFETDDEKFSNCKNYCQSETKHCGISTTSSCKKSCEEQSANSPSSNVAPQASPPVPTTAPSPKFEDKTKEVPQPRVNVPLNETGYIRERGKNERMWYAIRAGDLQTIRRMIEVVGLSPTYIDSYERIPNKSGLYQAKVSGLWINDIFNDTNTSHRKGSGLDRVLALFMELGMDVKATIGTRTAWGPNFQTMEGAKDRASRLLALEMGLQAGLVPNDDIGEHLFAELPQICGRDKSQFAIQVVDVLIKYLGPPLRNYFRREGDHGPETIADVLDRSFSAPREPKSEYEKELFAQQDERWENCAPLSRRMNLFMTEGK